MAELGDGLTYRQVDLIDRLVGAVAITLANLADNLKNESASITIIAIAIMAARNISCQLLRSLLVALGIYCACLGATQ